MIHCGEETRVWFQLASEPRRKISWRIDEYLAYAKTSRTETELRLALFNIGVISDLTEEELAEIDRCPEVFHSTHAAVERKAMRAKA
jgi:hypothetical protein